MKEFIFKKGKILNFLVSFIVIIFFSMLLITSKNSVAKEENQELSVELQNNVDITLSNYSNYFIDDANKGVITKFNVKIGVNNIETANIPINETVALIQLPKIEDKYPESVKLISRGTKLTNGKTYNTGENYEYNESTGQIYIRTTNIADENENKYINSIAGNIDEYDIISKYTGDMYNDSNVERKLNIISAVQCVLADKENTKIETRYENNFDVSKNIHNLIYTQTQTQKIYNGYIFANINHDKEYDTEYIENTELCVDYTSLNNKILLQEENKFVTQNNQELNSEQQLIYKQTKLNKNNIISVLGEDFNIKILKSDNTLIKKITKDIECLEDGTIIIDYEEEIDKINIETSKPYQEGTLTIENKKCIKSTMKNPNVDKIKVIQNLTLLESNITAEVTEKENEIVDSIPNASITLNNNSFTNEIQNDVTFSVSLKNKSSKDSLFTNPSIEIILPQEVEKIIVENVAVLYGNGLEKQNVEILTNKDGNKVISIKLIGKQTDYIFDTLKNETNIVIKAKIILKQDILSTDSNIKTICKNTIIKNEKEIIQETELNNIDINIISEYQTSDNNQDKVDTQGAIDLSNTDNKVPQKKISNINIEDLKNQKALDVETYAQVGSKKLSDGDTLHEKEVIKYVVKVKNNTSDDINNISIIGDIPQNTSYATVDIGSYFAEDYSYIQDKSATNYNFGIDKLKPGEEKTQFYEVVVNDLENEINQKDIQNNIVTKIEDQEYSKNVLNNKIIKAKIELNFKFYINRDKKDSFVYFLYVKNLTNETMNNIEITSTDFQKEMNVLFAKYFVEEMTDFGSISNGRLEGTIDQLAPGETKIITMDMWAENFDENVNEVPLSMAIDVKIDDDIYRTWEARRNAYPEYVTAKISLDKEGEEVKYDEDLTYTIHIKNESKIKTYVNIEDYLPEEIEGNLITYDKYIIEEKEGNSIHGNTEYDIEAEANLPYTLEHIEKDASIDYENEGHLNENVVIPAGKTLTITITAKAGSVLETTEVSNYVKVSGGDIETVTSNIVKFTLLSNYQTPIDPDNPDNPDPDNPDPDNPDPDNPDPDNPDPDNPDPDNQKTYSIFGVVWQDDNKDGKRESNEPTMSNVIVKLYNASNNSIVAKEDGTQQKVLTDNQGRYEFKDVKQGKYLVLFEYDTSNYNITQYQKEGVEENLNSDVIEKEVSIDNVIKKVGLTDTLEIANSNISNIDMGLIQNAIFDLKLDKYISKVIVENSSGKRQYSYDNSQLAKIEIKSKYLKETKITIEYNIKITNEGDVVAYANNIIDYLPKELEFNSVDNKGWVKQEDYLSNSSLSKELIEPGQTKELSLILTKKMTENATGTIVNIAEIGESKNLDNLTDVDSVANNKNKSEDDYSEAQLIISIDTGVITYTVIGIITLAILIFIFLYFKGKIFRNKKFKIVTKIFILSLFLTSILVSNVQALSIRWEGAYDNDPNAYYIGDDGNIYACGHTGWHQCSAENVHAYNNPPSQSEVTVTGEKEVSKKNIKLKKNSNSVVVKPSGTNNIIGPYKVQSNCTESSISGISIVYSKNGKKETATGTKNMVDSNGNTIKNFNMTQNKDFQFYLKFSNDVTRIESISVTVSVKNVKVTEKTTRYRATYYCTWVAPTYQHSFGSNISTDTTQPMYRYMTSTSTSNSNGSDSVSFGAYDISGSLLIKKTGTKSGESLSDVTFEITGPNNYNSTQKTNSNGEIRIDNLRVGKYTVVEKSIGLNGIGEKNYGYVVEGTPTQAGNVIAGGLKEFKFSNDYKLGSISIDKTDVDTHAKMKDIEFTLQMTSGLKNGKYVNRDSNGRATYHDTVQTLKTDSSGQIIIKDAFIGDYKLIETKNPYEAYEELPVGGKVMTGTIKVNTTENVSVTNKRKYVDLSGYAWEDMLRKEGKNEYLNGLYNADNADNADKKLENITVQLKDRDNNIIRTKITDSSGNYKFEKVEIDKLKDYYIEFIYNGMSYNTVDVQGLSLSNSTKAIEGSNRTQFNSEYKEITKGKSNSYKLNYETSDYKSKLLYGNKQNYKYGYNGQENPISGVDQQYLISATTKNAYLSAGGGNSGYLTDIMSAYEIRQNAITEVKNINLGVTKRHQPDLSVVKDIESVKVQINDTEHIYKYADRFNNKDIYGDGYTLEPRVKFGEKYGNMSYTRALYASDIKYKEQNEDKQLKVYVTYKIGVRNSSDRLISIVNEMADYYDDKYIVTAVGKEINPDGTIKGNSIQYRSEQSGTSGYQKIKITTDLQINPQTEGNIYVRLQVMPQQIVNILGDSNDEVKLDNITEIVSYGTKDKNGAIYAGIDVDSQPDSIQIGNIKTYEDDTDKAPGLKLVLQEERTTVGKVFLDSTGDLKQNDIRQGSGAYEEGEKGIPDVEVKLVDSVTNQTVKVYDENLKQWKDGITKTDNDGNYEISGFIPGYYKILYIWGDKTYKVQDYKGTIVDKNSYNSKGNGQNQNEEWYKDDFKKATNGIEWNTRTNKEIRVSDATDNYATREKIDGQTKIMINKNKENINKYDDTQIQIDDSGTMQDLITKMDSSTPIFKVNLEYSTKETDHKEEYELDANNQIVMNGIYAKKKDEFKYNIQSIDFGIVERARQILALDKKVQEAKIVLTDGSILVNLKIKEDGTIEDSTKYVAYIPKSQGANGQVKFEIDQEIIQGARLEIKYNLIATNIGEKEYLNKEYYLYGKGHGDTTDSDLATLNPKMIIDYLDDKIATDMSENDKWQVIQENSKRNELINKGLLSDTLQSTINSISKVVVSDNIAKNLKPGEKSTEIYLTGYKLLASTNDDTALENDAEIIKIEKTGGSTIQTTPGNYIPTDISTSEVDNGKAETIIIIPPTGLSTDYIMYIVLALTSLGILISGIILIKKYVLKY